MQSIDRAMTIIGILLRNSPKNKLTISELAEETDLPVSTLHRILKAMIKHRMIEQDERTKQYGIGNIWLEYGLLIYDTIDYVSQTRPVLENLMKQLQESVYLYKPMGDESMIIERIDDTSSAIRVYDKIGLRIPMDTSAANHVMLAFMTPDKRDACVRRLLPENDQAAFQNYLEEVREKGYAESDNERIEGTTSIAAPITNLNGDVHGAVGIRVISFNLTAKRRQFLADGVKVAAGKITGTFGRQKLN
ncbi:IclR family transcriptional regulator [Lentibacillus amyloliquefaciens]|uniref:IclR family transcriptional regulator n=1 Tax=Lentibacillus amyloliquefaciens TaxID=1472767 RepID=A0A0U4FJ85_9BACI|nr:IclR family transcriptional regulator [Lentibacillus amyloliquefaciens]ALX47812.1 IclR family transcriptional regulator [Lentibacillus amyloliquefaciens]